MNVNKPAIRIQTALLFLIAAPLAMLGWIGIALLRDEELCAKRQVAALYRICRLDYR